MRASLLLALCLLLPACGGGAKLDWFLYVPERLERYTLPNEGKFPEETVERSRIEELRLRTDDGVTLGAVYVRANEQPPRGYVLFFHGKGGNLDRTMPRLNRYANLGYDTLGIDYRGFGVSDDVPITEAGIDLDGKAAVKYLSERAGGTDRLFYAGQSFGTAPATQRALAQPAQALIIESGFASLDEFNRQSTRLDYPQTFITRDRWATSECLKDIHLPVLILHGDADDLIRPSHAEVNYAAANEPKQKVIVPGGGHSDLPEVMGDAYGDLIHAFVEGAFAAP
ncbi:MAG TPA: alpha/beta hydrolase [Myxococcaceae bacterium]|nr:alpha/beta hydrolase [Myxococcaceae bacterium]